MSRILKLAGVALVALLVQQLFAELVGPRLAPDLVLVFALAIGLRAGATGSLILAFALGFCVDVLSESPLGLYAMLRGTACAATRLFDRALYLRAPLPWAGYAAGYLILDGILMGATLRALVPDAALPWTEIFLRMPIPILLTAAAAAPVLWIVQRLDADAQPEASWASLGSRART